MVKGVKFLSLLLNASCSDVITVPLFFSLAPKPPLPLSSFDTHARWQTVTQSARSRWSYEKIEAVNSLQFTVDPRQYALDKNLHSKSIYFLKLTHQERVMEVQWSLKRTHSRPQSRRFFVTWSWNRYRVSQYFGHPVTHVQKLQISLLMLIADFCPSPLHWGQNFTSWALSRLWLLWAVLKMQTSLN